MVSAYAIITNREMDIERTFLEDWNTKLGNLHTPEVEEDDTASTERLKEIAVELAEIKERKKQWIRAYGKKAITLEELEEANQEDNDLEVMLKDEVSRIEEQQVQKEYRWTAEDLNGTMQDVRVAWPHIEDIDAKKMYLQEIFESITVNAEKEKPRARKINISITDFVPRKVEAED